MEQGRTVLTDAVRKVQLLTIKGYCATSALLPSERIRSKWNIDGHEWEVKIYPNYKSYPDSWVAVMLILVSQPQRDKLKVNLSCRLVDPSQRRQPSSEKSASHVFSGPYDARTLLCMSREDIQSSGYLVNDSLTVQCTITVLKELTDVVVPDDDTEAAAPPVPPSDLHRHFGVLWQVPTGADVTFVLESGERFLAHKIILAARSPVFMAEFFGGMNERSSQSVRIEDMEAAVFKAMLHFIYTDTAPELHQEDSDVAMTMAQHLLAAADRYGLERLKLMCESKLAGGISTDTAATTLALADQHNCSLLKTKCFDFIARSPETLDAVLATEGYNHLFASCPSVVTQLLRAAHGRRI